MSSRCMTRLLLPVSLLASLVASAEPREGCLDVKKTARFTVYFDHVELEKLVQTISDATCRSFIVAEGVRGKISIVGPENGRLMLDADQFYAAFLSALDANGLAAVPQGRFTRIVDKKSARQFPVRVLGDDEAAGAGNDVVTQLHRLAHVELDAARPAVSAFLSSGGEVTPVPPDLLIVTDLANNQERIGKVLALIDKPRPNELLRVVAVKHAAADELLDKVTRALSPRTPPKAGEALTSLADERTNRILLMGPPALVERAEALVAQLDVEVVGDARARVVRLKNADAKELASTLEAMTGGSSSARRPPPPGATPSATPSGDVRISVNEALNALLIVSSANDFRSLEAVIEELDRPVRQVFIETVILEVNVTRDSKMGVSFHGVAGNSEAGSVFGSQPEGAPSSVSATSLSTSTGLVFGLQGPVLAELTKILGISLPTFGVTLQASQGATDVNVMSMPHILTADNKEAVIRVGQKVPFQLGVNQAQLAAMLASGNSNAANLTQLTTSISRENVELKLTVKPHIGDGDDIRLELEQSAEELAGTSNSAGPLTSTRSQKTTVIAKNEETLVLGGIMQDRDLEEVDKTPVLGDIPIIGALFRQTVKTRNKVNLVVLLTPHIIQGPADFKRLVARKLAERAELLERLGVGDRDHLGQVIDFERKPGPLAAIHRVIERETRAVEPRRPEPGT